MQSEHASPLAYDHIISATFLLFLRSMQLYGQVLNQATRSPKILKDAKVQQSLSRVIETIEACGTCLQRLPVPPRDGEAADHRFRELGKDISAFAGVLKDFAREGDRSGKRYTAQELRNLSERIKRNFREAILLFEQTYPGRLNCALRSLQLQT